MRNIEAIIADAQKAIGASLHEAFEAGKAHSASELKARMVAFFDGLMMTTSDAAPHAEPLAASPADKEQTTGEHP